MLFSIFSDIRKGVTVTEEQEKNQLQEVRGLTSVLHSVLRGRGRSPIQQEDMWEISSNRRKEAAKKRPLCQEQK